MSYPTPEDPFVTSSRPPEPQPRRPRTAVVFLLALAVVGIGIAGAVGLGALTSEGEQRAGTTVTTTSPSLSPAQRDPNGKKACDDAEYAVQYKAWDNYEVALQMVRAAKLSTDDGITSLAVLLELQLALVAASQGQPDLAERNAKLRPIVEDLERYCRNMGML